MLKFPFSVLPFKILRKVSHLFLGIGEVLERLLPFLKSNLKKAEIEIEPREYLSMCFASSSVFFIFTFLFIALLLSTFGLASYFAFFSIALIFTFFAFMQQLAYPRLLMNKRIKGIERNLLAALQNILVQLSSGIPLFDILVNVSKADYGEVSKEFKNVVKEINAGKHQVDALEEMAATNPSIYFRRAIWQIVNGMKSGADMSSVIKEVISSLSEEQVIQIQKYGSQLNPLAMFYMLIAVIAPALGMTFLIILSSFIALSSYTTKIVFWGLYALVFFFQIMFLGIIRSRRPNLIGED